MNAARDEGVYGMTGRDEDHESWSPVSEVHWSEYDPPSSPATVVPETEEARERSPVPGNDEAMEDAEGVATVTPRGARYNIRSGALTLATLMCCIGEAQSTATTTMHATSAYPSLRVTMSIQLTATWALAMCAMVIVVAFTVVEWKLNRNGKIVHKTTGDPYDAAPQFDSSQFENPSGTHHFFPGNGTMMARLENRTTIATRRTVSANR
jgi:hypothetical protein